MYNKAPGGHCRPFDFHALPRANIDRGPKETLTLNVQKETEQLNNLFKPSN